MNDDVIHFETLWEMAEKVSIQSQAAFTTDQVIDNIVETIGNLKGFNKPELADEIKAALKKRAIGEVLFLITALSEREKIDVYSALKDEMSLQEMDVKADKIS